MHIAGAGMTFIASWVHSLFSERQRVLGTEMDKRQSTWILLHGDLAR